MKLGLKLMSLILLAGTALGQTTYTTTVDGCGAKNLGYCRVNVVDNAPSPQQFTLILDHRNNAQGPIETLDVETLPFPGVIVLHAHGAYTGFVADPSWDKKTDHSGTGHFVADDGSGIGGTFMFTAHYVATCSGRGCAGTVVGWHFTVKAGSVVTE